MKQGYWITAIGIGVGALLGWFYWSQWGCTTGCGITSSPVNSSLYGALMGGLVMNLFKKEDKQETKTTNN